MQPSWIIHAAKCQMETFSQLDQASNAFPTCCSCGFLLFICHCHFIFFVAKSFGNIWAPGHDKRAGFSPPPPSPASSPITSCTSYSVGLTWVGLCRARIPRCYPWCTRSKSCTPAWPSWGWVRPSAGRCGWAPGGCPSTEWAEKEDRIQRPSRWTFFVSQQTFNKCSLSF